MGRKPLDNGLTLKEERFCHVYIELKNATEAYKLSYNTMTTNLNTLHKAAHEVLNRPHVKARIEALVSMYGQKHEVNIDTLTSELSVSRALATAESQHSVAVSATMGKAKLHGLLSDNVNVTSSPTIATKDITNLEAAKALMFLASREALKQADTPAAPSGQTHSQPT